jgi:hypothetical protein
MRRAAKDCLSIRSPLIGPGISEPYGMSVFAGCKLQSTRLSPNLAPQARLMALRSASLEPALLNEDRLVQTQVAD